MSQSLNNDKEDSGVTMLDVLRDEEALEEDAHAVLGGSDDKFCTYTKGYVKRQALYACMTCTPDTMSNPERRAGLCLACSYHCHENHDLIELYTKRNFRCDCGSPKMAIKKCSLDPFKLDVNIENKYNQNFSGLYCSCRRPYPDPEDTISDEMIQCIICEDWYHTRHLGSEVPPAENYAEMICEMCIEINAFLKCYAGFSINNKLKDKFSIDTDSVPINEELQKIPYKKPKMDTDSQQSKALTELKNSDSQNCSKPNGNSAINGALFWPEGWREQLCKCNCCMKNMQELNVLFLLDLEDRAQFYEEQGKYKTRKTSQYECGLRALSSLNHTQQIDAITEYNKMTEKLKEYLQKFAENKKVVTKEDIKIFFDSIKSSHTPFSQPPDFCR